MIDPNLITRPVSCGPGGQEASHSGLLLRHRGESPHAGCGLHSLGVRNTFYLRACVTSPYLDSSLQESPRHTLTTPTPASTARCSTVVSTETVTPAPGTMTTCLTLATPWSDTIMYNMYPSLTLAALLELWILLRCHQGWASVREVCPLDQELGDQRAGAGARNLRHKRGGGGPCVHS